MRSLRQSAEVYRRRGFAIVRILPGQKRPTDPAWTLYSFEPHEFSKGCNIGIQSGRLSGDLVCIDIDSFEVLRRADEFLPRTGMIEGRPGKRRSHRWYRVVNIPPELTAAPNVAGGKGGPKTKQFRGPDKAVLVEFRGTARRP